MMSKPNFFIVGAPKSGTSSLHDYLGSHPEVFMSRLKEPIRFGLDLDVHSIWCIRDEQKYQSLFAKGTDAKRRGESTTWYLYSESAAREIKEYDPKARIIAMLRHPVDAMYSLHGQFLFAGHEDVPDFKEALRLEPERRQGRCIPSTTAIAKTLLYSDVFRYAEQLKRYFDVFGRENVKVIFFDDFAANTAKLYREVLEFLDIDPSFQPAFRVVNPAKAVSLPLSQWVARNAWFRRTMHAVSKRPLQKKVYAVLSRLTGTLQRPGRIPGDLRAELLPQFIGDIEALEELMGRDLSNWKK